ncbi:hypothetical protein V6N13_138827 [Hibiscus sabdariffa]
MSESLSLKMGILPQHFRSTKQLSFQLQDRDSSSTGQSCPEAASAGDSNIYGQSLISPSSGVNGIHGKHAESRTKLASLAGTQDYAVPPPLVDYSKSIASFYMCSLVVPPNSDEMFQQPDLRFSGYSPDYRGHAGNIHGDGNLHHLSGLS